MLARIITGLLRI